LVSNNFLHQFCFIYIIPDASENPFSISLKSIILKPVLAIVIVLFSSVAAKSQLAKGTWLAGCTAYFSTSDISIWNSGLSSKKTTIHFGFSPGIGYFLTDKLAAGLRPTFSWEKTDIKTSGLNINTATNSFEIGPFARYYFLTKEKCKYNSRGKLSICNNKVNG